MGRLTKVSKGIGGALVGVFLNHKMRRMILIASAATYLHTLDRTGECKLSDLNKMCKLSHNDRALEFPSEYGQNIWKGKGIEQLDLHGGHDSVVTKIMDNIPNWLRYGRFSDMKKDVEHVVSFSLGQTA